MKNFLILEDFTTEELEAEVAERKAALTQTSEDWLYDILNGHDAADLKGLLYSCYEVLHYFLGRMQEDFSELFYGGGQLYDYRDNIGFLMNLDLTEDEWAD